MSKTTLTATIQLPVEVIESFSADDLRWIEQEVSLRMDIEIGRMSQARRTKKLFRIRDKKNGQWICYGDTTDMLETADRGIAQGWADECGDYNYDAEVVELAD
jgi:hypothetical protein